MQTPHRKAPGGTLGTCFTERQLKKRKKPATNTKVPITSVSKTNKQKTHMEYKY